jgi:hypothetical protein
MLLERVYPGDTIDTSVGFGSNGNYYGDATLASIVITGSYAASATPVGSGCGGAGAPLLSCNPPVIGQNVTFSITNGTPLVSGALFASTVPAAPIVLGSGCAVYLDLATYFPLINPLATDSSGAWLLTLPVPNDAGLVGLTLALQAALFGTAGPLGLDITNGLDVMVGL